MVLIGWLYQWNKKGLKFMDFELSSIWKLSGVSWNMLSFPLQKLLVHRNVLSRKDVSKIQDKLFCVYIYIERHKIWKWKNVFSNTISFRHVVEIRSCHGRPETRSLDLRKSRYLYPSLSNSSYRTGKQSSSQRVS